MTHNECAIVLTIVIIFYLHKFVITVIIKIKLYLK